MNKQSDLLGQLKIDRGSPSPSEEKSPLSWLIGVALLVLAGGLIYAMVHPKAAVTVQTATARAISGPPQSASVLDASGYVVARRQATVSSKVTGKVLDLNIEEGQQVREGEVLARLDDSNARASVDLAQAQLASARSALAQLEVQLAEAARQLRRARELGERKLVSQAEIDTAQANHDQIAAQLDSARRNVTVADKTLSVQQRLLDDTVVRAPFSGVITVKNAQQGEMISPLSAGGAGTRTGIGTLVDMDSLEVEVDVNESFINRVQPGQPATAKLNAYPDWNIPAHVIAVIPTADRSKATVKVRIGFDARDPRILPEMGVRVSFLNETPKAVEAPKTGVLVPTAAITGDSVLVVAEDGRLSARKVVVAEQQGNESRVSAGLRAGERVVTSERSALHDGDMVRVEP
jgi:RND family efflux transporter MFP subunit